VIGAMGRRLNDADEGVHPVGPAGNWNESRYVDFWDDDARLGGWFRIGNRPNEGHAEMSACVYLPDGTVAFNFGRLPITANELSAGGQTWEIIEPWCTNRLSYHGDLFVLSDPWALTDPKAAFERSPVARTEIELTCHSAGLEAVMGSDQDHVSLIFLPGQADLHYQHLAHVVGTVRIGEHSWKVDGRGGKDHSWGARNWHAKIYLRWLVAAVDDRTGFMLVRAVGPTKQTRSGFVWDDGTFTIVDDFEMANSYAGGPHYELTRVELEMRNGDRRWTAVGTPQSWLPLRHRQRDEADQLATLRIVKSPAVWVLGDGRRATGHCEYHDLLDDGRPVGLHD
jgi:hypothetical protein